MSVLNRLCWAALLDTTAEKTEKVVEQTINILLGAEEELPMPLLALFLRILPSRLLLVCGVRSATSASTNNFSTRENDKFDAEAGGVKWGGSGDGAQ